MTAGADRPLITKRCSACGEAKPLDEFGVLRRSPDGRRGQCRLCRKAQNNNRARERAREHYWANRERNLALHAEWRVRNLDAVQAKDRAYREANRDVINAKKRAYYAANRDRLLAQMHVYYVANREAVLAWHSEWRARNPAAVLYKSYRLCCARNGVEPVGYVTEDELADVIAETGGICAYCRTGQADTIDHVVPVVRGGPHIRENIVPACRSCNSSKNDKTLDEWLGEPA